MDQALAVNIVQLEPMHVASFSAYGPSPEEEAWDRLVAWARPLGLLEASEKHRIFGFDTTGPEAPSGERGYEFWIQLEPGFQTGGEAAVKAFPGGKYAVYRIEKVGNPWETIPSAWQALVQWQESSPYKMGKAQCLEEHLGPADTPLADSSMDLYLSIE